MIALTGGKTGGHIIPLIAVGKELEDVIYIGGKGFLEEKICKEEKILFLGLGIKRNIITLLKESFKIRKYNIDVILSTGGYVSVPLLLYGIFNRIPIYLLEENVVMGLSNSFFSIFAKKVFLSYKIKNKKGIIVGQPLLKKDISYFKYNNYKCNILIIGGSLGSKPLCDIARYLSKNYKVCLVAGRYYNDYKDNNYYVFEYVKDLYNLMIQADLIISRAGAQTTAEIFYINKPCILIPSMKTKKNHQYHNARYFEDKKCCKVVLEDDIGVLHSYVNDILSNQNIVNEMKENQRKLINVDSSKIISKYIQGEIK